MPRIENRAVITALSLKRIAGLRAHVPNDARIGIAGVPHTLDDLVAVYQATLDEHTELLKLRAQIAAVLAKRSETDAKRQALDFPLKNWVLNTFGAESRAAHEIGFRAPRKGTKSPEDVANAVKLAKATREARRTMGRKQRLEIKGVLPAPIDPEPTSHE